MLSDTLIAPALLTLLLVAPPAGALAGERAEDEIRAALARWTQDFNQRNADEVCTLFSPELRYDFRGYPERGFDDICNSLKRTLADTSKTFTYGLDIREIIVEGDLAVVRLAWDLAVALPNGQIVSSVEPGMDVFRRAPDGTWKIVRYLAYSLPESTGAQKQ